MPPRRSRNTQEPSLIKHLLTPKLRRLGLWQEIQDHQAMLAFAKAGGPLLLQHARPERMERGTLYIRAVHSTWIQEMSCMKLELLAKMRTFPGGEKVQELRFLLGSIDELPSWLAGTDWLP